MNREFTMKILLLLACALSLAAQTANPPRAAVVLNGRGELVSVTGLFQSLLPGVPFGSVAGPLAAAFGTGGGAIKTDSQLILLSNSGQVQSQSGAPSGPAIFGFAADGGVGWVYFAGTGQIQSLDGTITLNAAPLGDAVIALGAANGTGLAVLARTGSQLWAETVALGNGAILSQTPVNGSAPAIYFEGGWLTSGPTGLLWGSQTVSLPEPALTLQSAGPRAVAVNGRWLLNGTWTLLEIPVSRPTSLPGGLHFPVGAPR